MSAATAFDDQYYQGLNQSRAAVVGEVLSQLCPSLGLKTTLDVGCGLGFFSGYLQSLGLQVTAVDGRKENTEEAARRFPDIPFQVMNVEDPSLRSLGQFDVVFCFGLLYHLENPFGVIRHLQAMTAKLLLVESVCFPGTGPMMALVDEELNEAQGLNHFAFYPTEDCLVKMFYRAGFRRVYRFAKMPDHPDFKTRNYVERIRTMLAASLVPINSELLEAVDEPRTPIRPWDATSVAENQDFFRKLQRFVSKPMPDKAKTLRHLLTRRAASPGMERPNK